MSDMFERERRSQRAYAKRMSFIRRQESFERACEEDREQILSSMNEGYFTEDERVAPDFIRQLAPDEIFVFGSDIQGFHNGGAAKLAVTNFGAIVGQGEGIQERSYAIPTTSNSYQELREAIQRFTEYAAMHPKQKFMLTAIGCGNAGYTEKQIALLFEDAYGFGNVYLPARFLAYLNVNN